MPINELFISIQLNVKECNSKEKDMSPSLPIPHVRHCMSMSTRGVKLMGIDSESM